MALVMGWRRSVPGRGRRRCDGRGSEATVAVNGFSHGEFRGFSPRVDKGAWGIWGDPSGDRNNEGSVDARGHLGGGARAASRWPARKGFRHVDRATAGDRLGSGGAHGWGVEAVRCRWGRGYQIRWTV